MSCRSEHFGVRNGGLSIFMCLVISTCLANTCPSVMWMNGWMNKWTKEAEHYSIATQVYRETLWGYYLFLDPLKFSHFFKMTFHFPQQNAHLYSQKGFLLDSPYFPFLCIFSYHCLSSWHSLPGRFLILLHTKQTVRLSGKKRGTFCSSFPSYFLRTKCSSLSYMTVYSQSRYGRVNYSYNRISLISISPKGF